MIAGIIRTIPNLLLTTVVDQKKTGENKRLLSSVADDKKDLLESVYSAKGEEGYFGKFCFTDGRKITIQYDDDGEVKIYDIQKNADGSGTETRIVISPAEDKKIIMKRSASEKGGYTEEMILKVEESESETWFSSPVNGIERDGLATISFVKDMFISGTVESNHLKYVHSKAEKLSLLGAESFLWHEIVGY